MLTCANCDKDALYTYEVTDTFVINYCEYHLPRFLHTMKNGGMLKTTASFANEAADALAALAVVEAPKPSKKKTTVVEEAPVEETPTEQ